jgi:hypothetical protein
MPFQDFPREKVSVVSSPPYVSRTACCPGAGCSAAGVTIVAPRRRRFKEAPRPSRVKSRGVMLSVDKRNLNLTYRVPPILATAL